VAASRMTETVLPPTVLEALKPEFVAPFVAYLVHEDTQDTGGLYEVGAGFVAKVRWERAEGVYFPVDKELTPEQIRESFSKITDFSHSHHPATLGESTTTIFSNLTNTSKKNSSETSATRQSPPKDPAPKQPGEVKKEGTKHVNALSQAIDDALKKGKADSDGGNSGPTPSGGDSGPAPSGDIARVFSDIEKRLKTDGPNLVKSIKGAYIFVVGKDTWVIDLRTGSGSVSHGAPSKAIPGSITITVAEEEDFIHLMTGKLNPTTAWSQGQIVVDGNMGLALKLQALVKGGAKL